MNQVKGATISNSTDLNLTGASWRLVADLLIWFCRKSSNEWKKRKIPWLPSSFAPWAPSGQVRGCRNLPGIALPSRRKSDLEVVVRGLVEKYQISRAIENRTLNTTFESLQKSFPCDVDSSVYDVGVRGRWQVSRIIESFHKILLTRPIENPNHIPMQKSYQINAMFQKVKIFAPPCGQQWVWSLQQVASL